MTLVLGIGPYLWIPPPPQPAEVGMLVSIGKMGKLRPREEWRLAGDNIGGNGDVRNPLELSAHSSVLPRSYTLFPCVLAASPSQCGPRDVTTVPALPEKSRPWGLLARDHSPVGGRRAMWGLETGQLSPRPCSRAGVLGSSTLPLSREARGSVGPHFSPPRSRDTVLHTGKGWLWDGRPHENE